MSENDAPTPRDIGREWARDLQAAAVADGEPNRWFDELYEWAAGRPEYIPWESAAPRFKLDAWLKENPGQGRNALDIGCGLGDNAACLVGAGYAVTGFDLSGVAARWADKRFGDRGITFTQGDLFDLPAAWAGAFDLVHETYNLQAMLQRKVGDAIAAIAKLVKPGGTLLVITRSREPDEKPDGPPWPLTRDTLRGFGGAGLVESHCEMFDDERSEPIPHHLATWTRPVSS